MIQKLEVTDDCDPYNSALDKHEVSLENFDMDTNDQSKLGPEPEIGKKTKRDQNKKLLVVVILL